MSFTLSLHPDVTWAVCDKDYYERFGVLGVFNWCVEVCDEVVPLCVRSDGNCLVHGACAGMWGLQDPHRDVRRMMFHNIVSDERYSLRWKHLMQCKDKEHAAQFGFEGEELVEWERSGSERHEEEWERLIAWAGS